MYYYYSIPAMNCQFQCLQNICYLLQCSVYQVVKFATTTKKPKKKKKKNLKIKNVDCQATKHYIEKYIIFDPMQELMTETLNISLLKST